MGRNADHDTAITAVVTSTIVLVASLIAGFVVLAAFSKAEVWYGRAAAGLFAAFGFYFAVRAAIFVRRIAETPPLSPEE